MSLQCWHMAHFIAPLQKQECGLGVIAAMWVLCIEMRGRHGACSCIQQNLWMAWKSHRTAACKVMSRPRCRTGVHSPQALPGALPGIVTNSKVNTLVRATITLDSFVWKEIWVHELFQMQDFLPGACDDRAVQCSELCDWGMLQISARCGSDRLREWQALLKGHAWIFVEMEIWRKHSVAVCSGLHFSCLQYLQSFCIRFLFYFSVNELPGMFSLKSLANVYLKWVWSL